MTGQWIDDDWNLALDQDSSEARRAWAALATRQPQPHTDDTDGDGEEQP